MNRQSVRAIKFVNRNIAELRDFIDRYTKGDAIISTGISGIYIETKGKALTIDNMNWLIINKDNLLEIVTNRIFLKYFAAL